MPRCKFLQTSIFFKLALSLVSCWNAPGNAFHIFKTGYHQDLKFKPCLIVELRPLTHSNCSLWDKLDLNHSRTTPFVLQSEWSLVNRISAWLTVPILFFKFINTSHSSSDSVIAISDDRSDRCFVPETKLKWAKYIF